MADRQLVRRLHRDARAAARASVRAELVRARQVRALDRARAALPRQVVVATGAGLAVVPLEGGLAALALTAAIVAGARAVRSATVLRRPVPPPLPAAPPAPPGPRSAAFPYVRRLAAVREELRRLLPLVAPAGRDAAEEAWHAAAQADSALRWQAARLAAVEPHRGPDPALLQGLEEGVREQERLVVAVADLVAASGDTVAAWRLRDAADRLHGLAQGLREVR